MCVSLPLVLQNASPPLMSYLDLAPTADPPACARKITALLTHAPTVGGSCSFLAATYLHRLILQMIHCLESLAPLSVKCDLEWEHSLIS